jgi:hypothetical protein
VYVPTPVGTNVIERPESSRTDSADESERVQRHTKPVVVATSDESHEYETVLNPESIGPRAAIVLSYETSVCELPRGVTPRCVSGRSVMIGFGAAPHCTMIRARKGNSFNWQPSETCTLREYVPGVSAWKLYAPLRLISDDSCVISAPFDLTTHRYVYSTPTVCGAAYVASTASAGKDEVVYE